MIPNAEPIYYNSCQINDTPKFLESRDPSIKFFTSSNPFGFQNISEPMLSSEDIDRRTCGVRSRSNINEEEKN